MWVDIRLNWPGHPCDGWIYEAEKTWRGYSFVGTRPLDPKNPSPKAYRRFYQLIPHHRALELS